MGGGWEGRTRWPMGFDEAEIPMALIPSTIYGTTDAIVQQLGLLPPDLTAGGGKILRLDIKTTRPAAHSIVVTQDMAETERLLADAQLIDEPLAAAVPINDVTSLSALFDKAARTFTPTIDDGSKLDRVRLIGNELAIYY